MNIIDLEKITQILANKLWVKLIFDCFFYVYSICLISKNISAKKLKSTIAWNLNFPCVIADVKTLVELAKHKEQPVTEAEARKMSSSLGCEAYIESSAVTQKNLKEVFDEAIVLGLKHRRLKEKKAAHKLKKSKAVNEGCFGGQCIIL